MLDNLKYRPKLTNIFYRCIGLVTAVSILVLLWSVITAPQSYWCHATVKFEAHWLRIIFDNNELNATVERKLSR